jgi:holliday junction DNA helicase RuvA
VGRVGVIAKLAGLLDQVGSEEVVIDVGGVGYLAFCSARTIGRLPPPGAAVRLYIETHVREDHIHLYGFADAVERDWFGRLTTVQGVGARLALAILSAVSPEQLAVAIAAQDKAALTQAEGVGAKLAGRIINELHDRVVNAPAARVAPLQEPGSDATADAVSALVNLGYRRAEAFGAVAAAAQQLGSAAETGALIRAGLKELAR